MIQAPRMHPRAASLALLLGLALLAGCSAPKAEPYVPVVHTYGLGLALPDSHPPPRAFQEDPNELAILVHFLETQVPRILEACGGLNATYESAMRKAYYLAALDVHWACSDQAYAESEPVARQAIQSRNEQQAYDRLLEPARLALAQAEAEWTDFTGPGSVVETEVVYQLLHQWSLEQSMVDRTAPMLLQAYLDNRTRSSEADVQLALQSAYLNLMTVPYMVDSTLEILHSYPWSHGTCDAPDMGGLVTRVEEALRSAIRLADSLENPDDRWAVNRPYGALAKSTPEAFEFFQSHDQWPGLLAMTASLPWRHAYYENFTQPVLPNLEEGRYLTALYQNQTRTLYTDAHVRGVWGRLETPVWDESAGLLPLTLPALKSPFQGLHCTA